MPERSVTVLIITGMPMISLADLQRRIDAGDLSADAAIAQSLEAIACAGKVHRRVRLP